MTRNHARKQLVRDRMAATGETYTQARQQLEPEPPAYIEVSIPLGTVNLTPQQQEAWLARERYLDSLPETGRTPEQVDRIPPNPVDILVEEHLKKLQADEEYLSEQDAAYHLVEYLGADLDVLEAEGVIDATLYHQSEDDARYTAFYGHKARALGLTIEEYRERKRWLVTDLTDAEVKWLYDTGRFEDKPGSDYYHARVDGELVDISDEVLLQFLAEYKTR
jgi:hypothetical protein